MELAVVQGKLGLIPEEDRLFVEPLSLWIYSYPFPVNILKCWQRLERGKDPYLGENYLLNIFTVNLFKTYFSKWVLSGVKVMESFSPSLLYLSH